ncbi:hypothetical protein TNCV_3177711 [Trichonephila clavipes]|nr:hypothetical protein TNCV_3177711 [Trichonephila clavipes]
MIEIRRPRGLVLFFKKFINQVNFVLPRIVIHKNIVGAHSTLEHPHIGFKDFLPTALCVDSTRNGDEQWCMTTQHYATPDKDSFSNKPVTFYYLGRIKASFTFSLDEDSTRITMPGESRLNTEKNTPLFLCCILDSCFGSPVTVLSC